MTIIYNGPLTDFSLNEGMFDQEVLNFVKKRKCNVRKLYSKVTTDLSLPIIGIDGEGWDVGELDKETNTREHKYGLLIAADENGKHWILEKNVCTKTCLDFILDLPANCMIIGFMFKYDLTKILEDLPARTIYLLNHYINEVEWKHNDDKISYFLSYMNGKFTVKKGKKIRIVWDFFKFFTTAFVKALKTWEVGLDVLEEISSMKEKRGTFEPEEIISISHYCYLECVNLARLGRKLIVALDKAKLNLDGKYFGAGSVGAAVLNKMDGENENILTQKAIPDEMQDPIGRAFFGGRFEISRNGYLNFRIFEHDISSAYPYQIFLIPCFRSICGRWILIKNRNELNNYKYGLVHYSLFDKPSREMYWAPFPYRTKRYTVLFPETSGGGWIWLREYLAGEKVWDNVKFEEAWVWDKNSNCNHPNPFKNIADLYIERCRMGKDGTGIVIKLGYNASYGKMAQCIGKAIYHNWIWAGMVTSGCRAQILELMALHKDFRNILMVATDGLYSSEDIICPRPIDTGTGRNNLIDETGNHIDKPLGGWESNCLDDGLFICRPGIYFKLNDDKVKKVRSRGINQRDLVSHRQDIIDHFEKTNGRDPYIFQVTRFYGMKTSVGKHNIGIEGLDEDFLYIRRLNYGRWGKSDQIMSFSPLPKRNEDFSLRCLPELELQSLSEVYSKFKFDKTEESQQIRNYIDMLEEQADCDNTIEDIIK